MTRAASPASVAPDRSVLEPQAPALGTGQLSEPMRMLAHELLFFCHRALASGPAEGPPLGPRLARFAAAYGAPEALPAELTVELTAEAAPPAPEAAVSEDVPPEAVPPEPVPPEAAPPEAVAPEALASEALAPEALTPEVVPPQPPSPAAQRSLADAVPGLPSAADLDFSSWTMAANADVAAVPDDEVKVIGPLRLEIPAFNAFLNDADEASRLLATLLAEWALEPAEPVPEEAVAQAEVLARGATQVGHGALAALADALAQALHITAQAVWPPSGTLSSKLSLPSSLTALTPTLTPTDTAARLIGAAEEIRRVLHQFAAGFLTEPAPRVLEGLAEISSVAPPPAGLVDLRYLQQVALLQESITQALDTLAHCRPSAAAAAQDPTEADQAFDAALAAAVAGVKASQQLLASALGHSGDYPA
jgi:chemosensory pili system protein ChpA (sensor histidine kinase/response regulator)